MSKMLGNDIDGTAERFRLIRILSDLPYGYWFIENRDTVRRAWRPTGDADLSIEGAIKAMSLARGGNRPERSMTTEERMREDLEPLGYEWTIDETKGEFRFHRKDSACPKCRGSMIISELMCDVAPHVLGPSDAPVDTAYDIQRTPCPDHGR